MSFPIQSGPGDQRVSYEMVPATRRRLHSEEGSNSFRSLEDMPLEICVMVASYLQGDDLKALAQFSSKYQVAALKAKNIQEMQLAQQELKVLKQFDPPVQKAASSAINIFLEFTEYFQDEWMREHYRCFQLKPITIETLQKTLTAFATHQVADELKALSVDCYTQINSGEATFENIEKQYRSKKQQLIALALHHIIVSTKDPIMARGLAVLAANDHPEILRHLLEKGQIYDLERKDAFKWAAVQGILESMQVLVKNQRISQEDLQGLAVWEAVKKGDVEVVLDLLAKGSISDKYLAWIIRDLAKVGSVELFKVFLARGNISDEERINNIYLVASRGFVDKLQTLLAERKISDYVRSKALVEAAANGHIIVVELLLANGSILGKQKGIALKIASGNGYLEIVKALFAHGPIAKEDVEEALAQALKKGHHLISDFLIQDHVAQKLEAL